MTTPNSFDAELDEILTELATNAFQSGFTLDPSEDDDWYADEAHDIKLAKQKLKHLYLTHRNAELENLLMKSGFYKDEDAGTSYTRVIAVSIEVIKDLIKGAKI